MKGANLCGGLEWIEGIVWDLGDRAEVLEDGVPNDILPLDLHFSGFSLSQLLRLKCREFQLKIREVGISFWRYL